MDFFQVPPQLKYKFLVLAVLAESAEATVSALSAVSAESTVTTVSTVVPPVWLGHSIASNQAMSTNNNLCRAL